MGECPGLRALLFKLLGVVVGLRQMDGRVLRGPQVRKLGRFLVEEGVSEVEICGHLDQRGWRVPRRPRIGVDILQQEHFVLVSPRG